MTIVVVREARPVVVNIGERGLQGQSGLGAGFDFIQLTALSVWTINHNLGYYPTLTCYTTGGLEIEGSSLNTSSNQLIVSFNTPIAGFARLI